MLGVVAKSVSVTRYGQARSQKHNGTRYEQARSQDRERHTLWAVFGVCSTTTEHHPV